MPQPTNKTYLVPLLSNKTVDSLHFQKLRQNSRVDRFKKHFPFFKSDFAKVIGFQRVVGKRFLRVSYSLIKR